MGILCPAPCRVPGPATTRDRIARDSVPCRAIRRRAGGGQHGTITGTIRHVDLEGGFYGIETDDGAKLDPVNLPAEFQKDGLRIRAYVESLQDRVSFHMWGTWSGSCRSSVCDGIADVRVEPPGIPVRYLERIGDEEPGA